MIHNRAVRAWDHNGVTLAGNMAKIQPRLELREITKRFPGVLANDQVSLQVMPGEIHALLGENGAGKSTLVKMIYGIMAPDSGEMFWDGAPVRVAISRVSRQQDSSACDRQPKDTDAVRRVSRRSAKLKRLVLFRRRRG